MKDLPSLDLGPKLRDLRVGCGLSLAQVALETGVSEATMSRIETSRTEVSAPHLFRLAALFDVEIASLFDQPQRGIRSISRKGEALVFDTVRFQSQMLCTDLRHKKMQPFINRVTATSLDQIDGLAAHAGEEYLFVTNGVLILHTEAYAPLELITGDSIYFDATMPHAYLSARDEGAEFLVICTATSTQDTHS